MTDDLEDIKRRLVVGHKRDGRCVYDVAAKAELVALCLAPDVSVARLARECGVNANQVARWLREHRQGRSRESAWAMPAGSAPSRDAFVAVPVVGSTQIPASCDAGASAAVVMQARLPNGVTVDLCGLDRRDIGKVIETLGGLRCSVSTKG